jgi:penicillin amidase
LPLQVALELLERPDPAFGPNPAVARDAVLVDCLRQTVSDLQKRFGPDPADWQWGKLHQAHLKHMLSAEQAERGGRKPNGQAEKDASRKPDSNKREAIAAIFNLPSVPRDGDGNTPMAAGGPRAGVFDQTTGASYRHIMDLADWDRSVGTSTPGQSGQPTSPHYADLLQLWEERKYFPLYFSRTAIESETTGRLMLLPADGDANGSR